MLNWTIVNSKLKLPYPVWIAVGVVIAFVISILAFGGSGPASFLVSPTGYSLQGSFVANGAYTTTTWPETESREPTFGSWAGSDSNTGSFRSNLFFAPRAINFCVAGYPGSDGISLYLENTAGQKLPLQVGETPHERWLRSSWNLPRAGSTARSPSWPLTTLAHPPDGLGSHFPGWVLPNPG